MSTTKQDEITKLGSKLKADTGLDNQIIDLLIERVAETEAIVEVKPVLKAKKQHPLIQYHLRGRTVNQLAGMFMITEDKVRAIIKDNENV